MFKKVSKAQNPYNSFYFHTRKCIGNTAHSIPNQNEKEKFIKFVTLHKVKKQHQYAHFSLQTQTFIV